VYHPTLGLRVIKKKKEHPVEGERANDRVLVLVVRHRHRVRHNVAWWRVWGLGFRVWGLGLRDQGLGFRVYSVGFRV